MSYTAATDDQRCSRSRSRPGSTSSAAEARYRRGDRARDRRVRRRRMGAAQPHRRHRRRAARERRGAPARRLCRGLPGLCRGRLERDRLAGASLAARACPMRWRSPCSRTSAPPTWASRSLPMLTVGAIEALEHHGTPEQQATYLPKLVERRMDRHDEPHRAAGRQRRRRPAHARHAARTTAPTGSRAPRSSSPSASTTWPRTSSTWCSRACPTRPPAAAASRCSSCPKYLVKPDGTLGAKNDVQAVWIEHKLGIHASPTCVLSYGDPDDCIGELDRRAELTACRRCSR